jgi:CRP/FNR family transcriptional regulator, anaerobic regulatory protein
MLTTQIEIQALRGMPIPAIGDASGSAQASRSDARCGTCTMRNVCLPPDLSSAELARFGEMVGASRTVRRGESLYRAGDPFRSIYAVKTGSFKTVVTLRDGREQVTGFHLPGEALGLDGAYTDAHRCDAVALEDSTLCAVPFRQYEALCHEVRTMRQHLYKLMSSEIARESNLMMLLGTMTAEERVASFLLNLSMRFAARGYSASEFYLRMTREEIGSYLGLKLETVSRMLSKFHKSGVVDTQGKLVRIVNREALEVV